jgi:hypothetical protein
MQITLDKNKLTDFTPSGGNTADFSVFTDDRAAKKKGRGQTASLEQRS